MPTPGSSTSAFGRRRFDFHSDITSITNSVTHSRGRVFIDFFASADLHGEILRFIHLNQ